jgi:hypothetical protein
LDDLEEGQIDQPDTGRRYETYELPLNKRKWGNMKGRIIIDKLTNKINEINWKERRRKKRENKITTITNKPCRERDTQRVMGGENGPIRNYVTRVTQQQEELRVRAILKNIKTHEQLDKVTGEMGVPVNKNNKGHAVYLNRYHATIMVFRREHVEKLLNMEEN